jgi:hypothetical protein
MTIPFSRFPKNTLNYITYLLTREGEMHSPTKTYKDFKLGGVLPYQNLEGK